MHLGNMNIILFVGVYDIITLGWTHGQKMFIVERGEKSAALIQTLILWAHFCVAHDKIRLLFFALSVLIRYFFIIFVVLYIIKPFLKNLKLIFKL